MEIQTETFLGLLWGGGGDLSFQCDGIMCVCGWETIPIEKLSYLKTRHDI